jgi:hypothetical protein
LWRTKPKPRRFFASTVVLSHFSLAGREELRFFVAAARVEVADAGTSSDFELVFATTSDPQIRHNLE